MKIDQNGSGSDARPVDTGRRALLKAGGGLVIGVHVAHGVEGNGLREARSAAR